MKTNYLIYYVLKLITKGQEWQYKNLNGKGDRPKLYFTQLQLIALLISILFVYTKAQFENLGELVKNTIFVA